MSGEVEKVQHASVDNLKASIIKVRDNLDKEVVHAAVAKVPKRLAFVHRNGGAHADGV